MLILINEASSFVDQFLTNLARLADTCVLTIQKDVISALVCTEDRTVICSSSYNNTHQLLPELESTLTLNIPDLKKLVKLTSLVRDTLQLKIEKNCISYTADAIRFKYHLLEDGIITSPKVNLQKLATLGVTHQFSVSNKDLKNIIKGTALLPDINKVYINFTATGVFAEIGDRNRQNTDTFSACISPNYTTPNTPRVDKTIPLNIEILRILSSANADNIQIKCMEGSGVLSFEIPQGCVNTTYVVSPLAE